MNNVWGFEICTIVIMKIEVSILINNMTTINKNINKMKVKHILLIGINFTLKY